LNPVHVIAEAGTNHNGSLDAARRLVDLAARAGADSVKFQIIDPDELYLPGRYEFGTYDIDEVRALRRRFMLADDDYRRLADHARSRGVPFTASVFDRRGLDLLASLAPPYVKIASTDLNNVRFLRRVAEKGIRMLVSTGMSSLADIEKSLREIQRTGFSDLVLLHCVSVYPARLQDMNLGFIDTLRGFGFPVGLSDHTESSTAACVALAKGIAYVEKHYTTDRRLEGFDHAYAAEGDAFVQYVADIRAAEEALRPREEKLTPAERTTRKRARRALYAAHDLPAGRTVQDEDVLVLRPENHMAADQIDEVIGRSLKRDVRQFEPYSADMFV